MNLRHWLAAAAVAVARLAARPGGWDAMAATPTDDRSEERAAMVRWIRACGVTNTAVLEAMSRVRRHQFIPKSHRGRGDYGDHPSPIGFGQTISQPYIVAYMTDRLQVRPGMKILEIGTGSGYQAAILAALGADVYTIEIIPELAEHARAALAAEGFDKVKVRVGDGYLGWPEAAPFDAILVTCAPAEVPPRLTEQLAEGGRMVIPVGRVSERQRLLTYRKEGGRLREEDDLPVRFVPMVPASVRPTARPPD